MGTVNVRHEGELLFACQVGNHTLQADVPPGAGGRDRGPTGTELLASALGCCMASAVVWFGARDGVDTSDLRVEVSYQWAKDPLRLSNLAATIHLPHATPEQRETLLEAARHCPVQETIRGLGEVAVSSGD